MQAMRKSTYATPRIICCHHVSAVNVEKVIKSAKAKYVLGLSATPTRKDGHHPIIFMQCGKIRYMVDTRKEAGLRPFKHIVMSRITDFKVKAEGPEDDVVDKDIILYWGKKEKRIITGADLLGRLLRGIVPRG